MMENNGADEASGTNGFKIIFPCPMCGKMQRSKADLTKHMRSHTKERPFKCPDCDRGFTTKVETDISWFVV